ncbi:hypothetical protein BURK1_03604 [Burkholderiales bacterium]|nr:hypothetical protein BURK1_03604 [Burkholderiales bacterium]
MTGLAALWLPILLASVLVFVASSIIHMALPWHRGDYPALPDEDQVRGALRRFAIPPGDYMIPRASSMDEFRTPQFAEKLAQGPVMIVTVLRNGPFSMGRNLTLWFAYCVVVSILAAYVTGRALPEGASYMRVFQLAGAVAFAGYALALWQMWIWYHRALGTTIRATIDGLLYALLTAGALAWLWPR